MCEKRPFSPCCLYHFCLALRAFLQSWHERVVHLHQGVYSYRHTSQGLLMESLVWISALWQNCIKPSQTMGSVSVWKVQAWHVSLRTCGQKNSGLCGSSAWPHTCIPQGHTRAGLNWESDYGSTVPALAVALSSKSPVLTDWDKWDEIINKTLPLLVPINTMDKKAMLQTVFSGSSVSSQKTRCCVAKACELSSPQPLLPLHRALVSLQRLAILDSLLRSGVGEGSLAPCPYWTGPGTRDDTSLVQHWETRTMVSQWIPINRRHLLPFSENKYTIYLCVGSQSSSSCHYTQTSIAVPLKIYQNL